MASNQDTVVSCTRCNISVPMSKTTYGDGKNLICFSCYNKIVKGIIPDKIMQQAEPPQKVDYECHYCGFKFSRTPEFQFGGKCFNCGNRTLRVLNSTQALMKDRKSLLDY
ncbi:hypothetical protein J4216_02150 [Candidatus Woesearchaeota archaeon]|nr:hypothetical protein [Candidatus Woesearchaeota archaeon]